jgi:hypothetical protein
LSYEAPEPVDTHDGPAFGMELETLDDEQLLLIGRLNGTPDDEHTRRQAIDDYVSPRLDGLGFDVQSDTFTIDSFVYWIVDLPDGPEDLTDAFGEHQGTWTVAYTIDGIRDWTCDRRRKRQSLRSGVPYPDRHVTEASAWSRCARSMTWAIPLSAC